MTFDDVGKIDWLRFERGVKWVTRRLYAAHCSRQGFAGRMRQHEGHAAGMARLERGAGAVGPGGVHRAGDVAT
jgi:hypothetical protein